MPPQKKEEKRCDFPGCKNIAERSLPRKKAEEVLGSLEGSGRRVHLCKEHYKKYRKATKKERELERMGW
ncbi:MAG: hypothetical protein J7L88_00615 [Thermoplasmata archaeon]|nr:hypothetical protein [Thermoplasmata archaeon]